MRRLPLTAVRRIEEIDKRLQRIPFAREALRAEERQLKEERATLLAAIARWRLEKR